MIEAWNKLDRVDEDRRAALVAEADRRDDVVALSALTGEGLERLITAVADRLTAAARVHRIQLSSSDGQRSEAHTSELQSLMRISYAVFCLTKKTAHIYHTHNGTQ